ASTRKVDRAQAESMVQGKHVEEIGQIQDDFNEKIQAAAAQQNPAKVTALVQQHQLFTSMINEDYAWISKQLTQLGDTESLKSVAAGVATGGLYGGLQNLQQVLVTHKLGDVLASEASRRMADLAANLMQQHDGEVAASAPRPSHTARVLFLPSAGQLFLLLRGRPIALPQNGAELPPDAPHPAERAAAPALPAVPGDAALKAAGGSAGTSAVPLPSAGSRFPGSTP
ncbi:MAG TPA: hypothetical protein VK824_06685, partial [Planctomycetota bacterium]|nr:hypothetical protein [Planctomycetota bacterium]